MAAHAIATRSVPLAFKRAEWVLNDRSDTMQQPDIHIAHIAGKGRFGTRI
ncbi:hypothetical protein [uncultured Bosea sp.]|nr:hypothetical protein [uncultured Bosea sp.]